MEVFELWELIEFEDEEISPAITKLNQLVRILKHNATNPQKQPVLEALDASIEALRSVPLESLSHNQLVWLKHLGITSLLGEAGALRAEAIVQVSDFDPATASTELQKQVSKLSEAQSKLKQLRAPLQNLPWVIEHPLLGRQEVEVRIVFQNDVKISNTAELKKRSADWYDIVRGVTSAVGLTPEDVTVKGVGNGSVLIWLTGASIVTLILAKISKHVSGIALDGLKVASAIEDLRQKRMLTTDIERQLKENHQSSVDSQKSAIAGEIKTDLELELEPENTQLLEQSISKMLTFFQKGGELDFIEPSPDAEDDGDERDQQHQQLSETIAAIREHKKETLLLTADKRAD